MLSPCGRGCARGTKDEVQGFRIAEWGLWGRVGGSGRVGLGLGLEVWGSGFEVWGLGCGVWGRGRGTEDAVQPVCRLRLQTTKRRFRTEKFEAVA